mmetsp:Transcript_25978/g.40643  ORF Transcript_25978/g.40643 Transcript_25978/m.40643 type:complete len:84 (+) Transcript_25978:90-341(+)
MINNSVFKDEEKDRMNHKIKRLIPTPESYFMQVKCPQCENITLVFSHSQSSMTCKSCSKILCYPTGGKVKLTCGVFFSKQIKN